MGCDGGTIPKRDELVRSKKKPEQIDKDVQDHVKWKMCSLSQQPLREPIVACRLGFLYNKEAIIRYLLDSKTNLPGTSEDPAARVGHIRSLKDVKVLKLSKNPVFKDMAEKGDGYQDRNIAEFICPIVGLEMNGKYRFVLVWSCGCVFSERSLKEVKFETCQMCAKPFAAEDVIVINCSEDELSEYRTRLHEKRQAKGKKGPKETDSSNEPGPSKARMPSNHEGTKRKANGTLDQVVKKSKSIQDDPNTTKVYKSLFTSKEKEDKKPKAHWVTYNPYYN